MKTISARMVRIVWVGTEVVIFEAVAKLAMIVQSEATQVAAMVVKAVAAAWP